MDAASHLADKVYFSKHRWQNAQSLRFYEPPSEREGDHVVVEGACATKKIALFNAKHVFYNAAFSFSRLRRQLPLGGSLVFVQISILEFVNEVCQ